MEAEARKRISKRMKGNQNRLGKQHEYATKYKIKKANIGYVWWTNGPEEVKAKECPGPDFIRGRKMSIGEKVVATKVKNQTECHTSQGYRWYTNGFSNLYTNIEPIGYLQSGKVVYGMVKKK